MASISSSPRNLFYPFFHPTLQQWLYLVIPALINYLLLVRLLRYRRLRHSSFQHLDQLQLHPEQAMDVLTAFKIHVYLIELEFPSTFSAATTFALFKAYGIPSISSLLVYTNQLAGPPLASSKRYADTGALLLEAVLNEPGSGRSVEAITRINYLHGRWRGKRKGKGIRDEDMLYTLSLFALEPMKWVKKYEWRELSMVEICAVGTLWKYLGDALKVPFHLLPGHEKGWKNGVEWMEELRVWSEGYEGRYMVPDKSNAALADATIRIILWKVPRWMHGFGKKVFAAAMEENSPRLRKAMLYVLLLFLRYLSLPRYHPLGRKPTPSSANDGRFYLPRGRMYPWYIRPTFKKRWGPSALLARLRNDVLPGDDAQFMPEGFATTELGPIGLTGKGYEEMAEDAERLVDVGGCPFVRV
ncbi:MAG: hypothetical protein Q9185_001356 [Variospora sp. 1 TL-2023]